MPPFDRIALISDVHGNQTALEAVFADLDGRGVSTVMSLGDVAGKGPRGRACVALVRDRCAVAVQGNWDEMLGMLEVVDDRISWWHAELAPGDRAWLGGLPFSHDLRLSGRNVRLFHASATSVWTRVHTDHSREEFDGMFAATDVTGDGPEPDVVCYGDIHDAFLATVERRSLVNVGSVGGPLDGISASYVILEGVREGTENDPFGVQIIRVPYDVEAEIAVAASLRMPELEAYAIELRTAVYRSEHAARGLHSEFGTGGSAEHRL
jgi:protein phosphatase